LTGDQESYVCALTNGAFEWHTIPSGRNELAQKVAAFRRGLDLDAMQQFDIGLANELFAVLIGPVDTLVRDKGHLLVAPSGTLTALPFHLLVTEKPAAATPMAGDAAGYRGAAWLVQREGRQGLPPGAGPAGWRPS